MVSAISQVFGYIYSPVESILKKGLSHYIFDKLNERNPLQASPGYQKEVKNLRQHLVVLKGINRQWSARVTKQKDKRLEDKLKNLHQRMAYLNRTLSYLHLQEQGLTFLKWAAPCNLILPGSGDVIRTAAYAFKMFHSIKFYFKYQSQEEFRQVASEITLSRTVSIVTGIVYDTIQSLKEQMTHQNFRALFYY